ncbi:MAG TPA: hypothetical protein VN615_15900 [Gaiellales bacterium]|nr:hypothetical protein [Gaiellales bacterium]
MEDPGFELVAASLRADATDLAAFVEALAVKLEGALPGSVRVERHGGLLSREKRVRRISVTMAETRYDLERDDGALRTSRCSEVRGIVIKSEPLDLDAWIEALSRDLSEQARQSERARIALERLLDG